MAKGKWWKVRFLALLPRVNVKKNNCSTHFSAFLFSINSASWAPGCPCATPMVQMQIGREYE